MKLKNLCQLALCLFICYSFQAQNKIVGKIMNLEKKPIDNAQVFLDDKKADVLVNSRGYFELEVPEDVKEINIYSPVYGLLTTAYLGESSMSFVYLNPDYKKAESDKIDIGYGEIDREDLSYGIPKIDPDKSHQNAIYDNIYDLIRGRLAGVTVTSNNRIIIRGTNSIRSSTDPLFVVDGSIVYSIDHIRPIEVKDISVLKGAAASIYGSQGSNGVIQIVLKK